MNDWEKAEAEEMARDLGLSPGAVLAALRKVVTHSCAQCGESFEGIQKAKYCSNRCRQAAKYQRSKSSPL